MQSNEESIELRFGEDVYTSVQVKRFLKEIYTSDAKKNISTFNPKDRILKFKLLVNTPLISTQDKSEKFGKKFIEILTDYVEFTGMRFDQVEKHDFDVDILFVFSDVFSGMQEYGFIREVSLGDPYTNEQEQKYNEYWESIDKPAGGKNSRAPGIELLNTRSNSITKSAGLLYFPHKSFVLGRIFDIDSTDTRNVISVAICEMLLQKTGFSSAINNSCLRVGNIQNNTLAVPEDRSFFPFDAALINTLYLNPFLQELKTNDAIEEIMSILIQKYKEESDVDQS